MFINIHVYFFELSAYLERCFPGCFFKQHTCTRCHGGSVALQQDGCNIQWTSSRLKGGLLRGRCKPGDSIQPIQSLCTCVVSRIAIVHTRVNHRQLTRQSTSRYSWRNLGMEVAPDRSSNCHFSKHSSSARVSARSILV